MGNSEFTFVKEAFATNWIAPAGPHISAFEREFAQVVGTPHAAAISSGTAAIHLALQLCGVTAGDEVVCSSLTFVASVNPILQLGAVPVLVDSDDVSWNMDPALLRELLEQKAKAGKRPKAVVLVHLYGQSADIDPILDACEAFDVPLIEDAAEALGASYFTKRNILEDSHKKAQSAFAKATADREGTKIVRENRSVGRCDGDEARERVDGASLREVPPAQREVTKAGALWATEEQKLKPGHTAVTPGTLGRYGIYSFNGNKIITTSGGGMLVSADGKGIDEARFLATQARDPAPHYEHSRAGFNYRMSNVLAGIGRGQLQVLSERVNARRRVFARYVDELSELPGVSFMPEAEFGRSTRWLSCLTIDPEQSGGVTRERVRLAMEAENIEARPVWKPMHQQPLLAGAEMVGGAVSERLFELGLCLPSGSNLTSSEIDRVIACFRAQWNQATP